MDKLNHRLPGVPQDPNGGGNESSQSAPSLLFSDLARPIRKQYEADTPIDEIEGETAPIPLYFNLWQSRHKAFKTIQSTRLSFNAGLPGSPLFWNEIKAAKERVYLIDKHIDQAAFLRILEVLKERESGNHNALSVILLTNPSKSFNALKTIYEGFKFSLTTVYVPRCDQCVIELMHDRFAVIDDAIWHFGATIGGMHECINAFSGPWTDPDGRMRQLIEHMSEFRHEGDESYFGAICI